MTQAYQHELHDEDTIEITIDLEDSSDSGFDIGISCHEDSWNEDDESISSFTLYLDYEFDCTVSLLKQDDDFSCTSFDEITVDSFDDDLS